MSETGEVQRADDPVATPVGPEGQAVGQPHPNDADDPHDDVVLHEHAEDVLAPDHPPVEEGQTGRHEEHERGACEHPSRVTSVDVWQCCPPPENGWPSVDISSAIRAQLWPE